MSQKKYKEEASCKVRAKLAQIREQEKEIGALIESIVSKAEFTAESLLSSTGGKTRFLSRYRGVQQELEEVANKLFITKTSLLDDDDADSDDDSRSGDQTSVVPPSQTSALEITEVIEAPPTPPMHSTCLEEPQLPALTEGTKVDFELPEEISRKVEKVIEKACRPRSVKKRRRARERASLPPLKLDTVKLTDVYVTEVYNPSLFWVQVKCPALDDLMQDLQAVEDHHKLSLSDLDCGMLVKARFLEDGLWYRAYVTAFDSSGSVDVIYADYGNSCRLSISDVQRIPSQFTMLPACALCCSLANVASMERNICWPKETIALFAVHLRPSSNYLVQMAASFEGSCPLLFVEIHLPDQTLTVNKLLVNEAHARTVPNSLIAECYEQQQQIAGEFVYTPEVHATFFPEVYTTQSSAPLAEDLTASTPGKHELPILVNQEAVDPDVLTLSPEVPNVNPEVQTFAVDVLTVTQEVPSVTSEIKSSTIGESMPSNLSTAGSESARLLSSVVSVEKSKQSSKREPQLSGQQPSGQQTTKPEDTKQAAVRRRYGPNQRKRQRSRRPSAQSEVSTSRSKAVSDDSVIRSRRSASPQMKPKQQADSGVMDDFDDFVINDDMDEEIERLSVKNNLSKREDPKEVLPVRNQRGLPLMDVAVPPDSCVKFLMSHVISPSKFWVHLIRHEYQALDELMDELNSCYRASEKEVMRRFFQEHQPQIGDFCCAQFSQDGRYYRAQVTEFKLNEITELLSKIQVFYIDYGNSEWLPPTKIFPLHDRFLQHPAMALACRAVDVQPSGQGSDRKDPLKWSRKAVEEFINLTGFHHELTGFLVELQPSTTVSFGLNDVLDLLVIDSADEQEFSVGDKLKEKSLAQTLSPFASASNINPEPTDDDDFGDPMAEEFLSLRNSYAVDTDDPGVATMGFSANDEKNVCHFFRLKGRCRNGDLCPFLHDSGAVTSAKAEVFAVNDSVHVIKIPPPGSFVVIEITAIFTPNRFYAVFPYGSTPVLDVINKHTFDEGFADNSEFDDGTLESLNKSMEMHYGRSSSHSRDLFVLAVGEIVVAQFEDGKWYRARVIIAEPEEDKQRVKVFFVDYGNSAWVKECYVKQMEPRFMHLPFQAVECFLSIEPTQQRWSPEAMSRFSELAEGRLVIAEVLGGAYGTMTCDIFDASPDSKLPNQNSVSVNQVLINEGHAKKVERKKVVERKRTTSNASSSSLVYIPG